ncbi:MAG: hypothetical protein IJP12_04075 [Methanobrevibacter sp.]|nr:hypothetical protein [Methanobrevibacter sp.]
MYYYKLESVGYEEHWIAIYCSEKKYANTRLKKIVKEAYIETCKYISDNGKAISEFDYYVENIIFDVLMNKRDKSQPCHYFNRILKEKYDLVNLDDNLHSKVVFGTNSMPNKNTREFYDERDNYDLVGLSEDDFKGYL